MRVVKQEQKQKQRAGMESLSAAFHIAIPSSADHLQSSRPHYSGLPLTVIEANLALALLPSVSRPRHAIVRSFVGLHRLHVRLRRGVSSRTGGMAGESPTASATGVDGRPADAGQIFW